MAAGGVTDDDDQGAPPPVLSSPSQIAQGGDEPTNTPITMPGAEQQPTLPGAAPPGQPNPIQNQPQQQGKIPTYQGQTQYDQKKLARAQTPLDILNAMKPASRNDYMQWWEQQHGAINDHYDALQKQLGTRPDDDQPLSRKEKFGALLEFGLHLMKASAKPSQSQGAVLAGTLSDEADATQKLHQQNVQKQQGAYDQSSNAIEAARTQEQKGIGTPREAFQQQETMNKDRASELRDTASAAKDANDLTGAPKSEPPRSYVDKNGQQYERNFNPIDGTYGPWQKSMSGGQPLPPTDRMGPRGGAGGRASVYSQKMAEFDQRSPLPANATPEQKFQHDQAALAYASGSGQIDSRVYANARQQAAREIGSRSNYDPADNEGLGYDDAIRARTGEVYDQYSRRSPGLIPGPGTQRPGAPQAQSPSGFGVPPASMLQGLAPGAARKINGAYWTLGFDGQPRRVDTTLAP